MFLGTVEQASIVWLNSRLGVLGDSPRDKQEANEIRAELARRAAHTAACPKGWDYADA